MAFGPDGDLYIGVGDGGSEDDPHNNGQSTDTLLGKILRIAPSAAGGYTIPSGNPFAGQPGKRPEIWAYGLRNPWRFSFDRATGDMIVGDVGQDQQEEVDFIPARTGAGANYGWSVWEGTRRNKPGSAPGAVPPTLTVSPQQWLLRDHRRLRRARPHAAEPLRPLPVRRLLPCADRVGQAPARARERTARDRAAGERAVLARAGRERAHLPHLARRSRLPDRRSGVGALERNEQHAARQV